MSGTQKVALLGVPYDEKSSYLRGAVEAPGKIREALASPSSNFWSESGVDVSTVLVDRGNVTLAGDAFAAIRNSISAVLDAGELPLTVGGDHSITLPVVEAVAIRHKGLSILHFDAHPDLYDIFEGDRYSHACPFARIMEARLAKRLVQVGIRTANRHQKEQAARFGVEVIEARQWSGRLPVLEAPLYVSLDVDVLEPAMAPGISHYEPGGLTVREVVNAIQSITVAVVGADVVELNPRRDVNGITAMVAAKLVKELAAKMTAR